MTTEGHDQADLVALANVWERFAIEECGTYTPLYRTICRAVARRPEILQLAAEGPAHARQPNLLLAAVHQLVLRHQIGVAASASGESGAVPTAPVEPLDRLAAVYRAGTGADPGEAFIEVVLAHRETIAETLATRFTQTNECGRSAPLALALAATAAMNGDGTRPALLALIDAGCSAGLNLAVDRYRIDFGHHGALGPVGGARVVSELRGPNVESVLPLPSALECIGWRIGLERAPVDLSNADEVDWMLACLWPEHHDRLERATTAIAALADDPPRIIRGDMVADVQTLIEQAPESMLATVVTSWAAAYLRPEDRHRFVEALQAASQRRPVMWLSLEGGGVAPGIELPDFTIESATTPSVVGLQRFDAGSHTSTTLGWTHPHGAWYAPA